ncbi:MAG: OadG family protein [Candidatus Competibacteraceae bacterium]|jgi:Na+-transporting methylmalonyl-CoA/oxaloacetate decarboxylase gamma subunit|nr:OadG family protein [Candidatus Competibacteraceae bacterium]
MPYLTEALTLAVVGICTVFVALIVTGIVVSIIGRINQSKPAVAAAAPLPEESPFGGLDKHTIVLLAAAATAAVKRPVRIRRVRFVSHKHVPNLWAAVGRVDYSE